MAEQKKINLGIDQSPGDSTSFWTGELPLKGTSYQFLQQYAQNNARLQVGKILDVSAGAYTAQVNTGLGTFHAKWCSESITSLFGSGSFTTPQYGSYAIIYTPPSGIPIILGCFPPEGFSPSGVLYRAVPGGSVTALKEDRHSAMWQGSQQSMAYPYNAGRPTDIFPGDYGWINEDGSMIGLLRGSAAILKGAELSQIQAFSMDDLVRVVARNLQIYHALGETHIYDDEGFLSSETIISPRSYEALGKSQIEDIGEEENDSDAKVLNGYYKLSEGNSPLYRASLYSGYLGDLFRLYCLKRDTPEEPISVSKLHIDSKGSVHCMGTRDLLLRRAGRIPLPLRLKEVNDPEGDTDVTPSEADDYEWSTLRTDGKALEEDAYLEHYDGESSDKHFRDFPADWEIQDNIEFNIAHPRRDAHIHVREDGSILLKSHSGSTIEFTESGDIVIAPARDLIIQPGRDLNAVTSRTTNIRSREHCTFVCDTGDFRCKAEGNLQFRSENSSILLETRSTHPYPTTGDTAEEMRGSGIILRSTAGAPVILESAQGTIQLEAGANITQNAGSQILVSSAGDYTCQAEELLFKSRGRVMFDAVHIHARVTSALGGNTILISASNNCIIHAPNQGVDVAHTHYNSEMTYVPDAHGEKVHQIVKRNSPVQVTSELADPPALTELTEPWTLAATRNIKFLYRSNAGQVPLYYTYWQNKERSERAVWVIGDETIENTRPYPGFTDYFYNFSDSAWINDDIFPGVTEE